MEKYANHLKNNLKAELFELKEQIFSSLSGEYFRTLYNKNPDEVYILRKVKLSEITQQDIQKELVFLDKISTSPTKIKIFPEYYGFYQEYAGNTLIYNIILENMPYNLATQINYQTTKKQLFPFSFIKSTFNTLLHGYSFCQSFQICPPVTHPVIFGFPFESESLKFMELGTHKPMKNTPNHYFLQLMKAKLDLHYISPEAFDIIMNESHFDPVKKSLDPYKSESFAMGLLILELGTLKPIMIKSNRDVLNIEIQSRLSEFMSNYSEKITDDDEISDFQGIHRILNNFLQIEQEDRWDFLEALKERMVRKERLIYHLFVEEASIGELQQVEWSKIRRKPLKKPEEKQIKSIYSKEFSEYMEESKGLNANSLKKIDEKLLEKGIDGISLANLSKENGELIMNQLSEFLKFSKSIQNIALWGNAEIMNKNVFVPFCQSMKVNNTVHVLDLGDNGLGLQKKAVKGLCKALRMNQTLTTLNLGGNKIGTSAKNMKPLTKLLKINRNIKFLGLGSNSLGKNLECMKILGEIIKHNTSLRSLGLAANDLSADLDAMKILCEALSANKTLFNLTLGHNLLGRNPNVFSLLCRTLAKQSSLKSIDLESNYLGERSTNFDILKTTLNSNKGLKNLGLESNLVGKCQEGFQMLIFELMENDRIESLALDANELVELGDEILRLEELFKKNKALSCISLRDNQFEKNKNIYTFLTEMGKKYGLNVKLV